MGFSNSQRGRSAKFQLPGDGGTTRISAERNCSETTLESWSNCFGESTLMDSHDGIPAPHCGILGTSPHISVFFFWGGTAFWWLTNVERGEVLIRSTYRTVLNTQGSFLEGALFLADSIMILTTARESHSSPPLFGCWWCRAWSLVVNFNLELENHNLEIQHDLPKTSIFWRVFQCSIPCEMG